MCWIWLLLAGIFEVGWACAMKYSDGLTAVIPTAITIISYLASAVFLAFAFCLKAAAPRNGLCHVDWIWDNRYSCSRCSNV